METLDEFDNEYPLLITFCERISPQAFEKQSLSYTQKSLQNLYTQMEQNPRICERILRKRKQMENEEAGVVQYLKAKFFAILQGDMNYNNFMEEMEIGEKAEQLMREMQKASDYGHSAKIVPWKHRKTRTRKNILSGGFSPSQISLSDSRVATVPKIFGSFPKQMERALDSNTDLKQLWAGMSSVNQKSIVDLRPLMLNPGGFRPPYFGSNSFCRLKYSSFPRTPINSPTSSSQSAGPSSSGSVFNTPILAKFRENKDDEKDMENPGPGSHFTEP
ncbi:uncharacterized protein LOC132578990 [Heteronotia binoei]|uniref:uncharacterized protein LOC132578990 n=1 Tax=Heteronotia binoei TaxID=13085 RepID=UPI002930BEE3|nr:uncharacterized protein LOC132578990 [Heteronotia binoei]